MENKLINPENIVKHLKDLTKPSEQLSSNEILQQLLKQIEPVNFVTLAFTNAERLKETTENNIDVDDLKVKEKHQIVIAVEEVLCIATKNQWGLCKNGDFDFKKCII